MSYGERRLSSLILLECEITNCEYREIPSTDEELDGMEVGSVKTFM